MGEDDRLILLKALVRHVRYCDNCYPVLHPGTPALFVRSVLQEVFEGKHLWVRFGPRAAQFGKGIVARQFGAFQFNRILSAMPQDEQDKMWDDLYEHASGRGKGFCDADHKDHLQQAITLSLSGDRRVFNASKIRAAICRSSAGKQPSDVTGKELIIRHLESTINSLISAERDNTSTKRTKKLSEELLAIAENGLQNPLTSAEMKEAFPRIHELYRKGLDLLNGNQLDVHVFEFLCKGLTKPQRIAEIVFRGKLDAVGSDDGARKELLKEKARIVSNSKKRVLRTLDKSKDEDLSEFTRMICSRKKEAGNG